MRDESRIAAHRTTHCVFTTHFPIPRTRSPKQPKHVIRLSWQEHRSVLYSILGWINLGNIIAEANLAH